MAIVKMKKLRLYGAAEEQTQLIRELQLLGCVEIGAPQQLTDTDGEARVSRRGRRPIGRACPDCRPADIRTGNPQKI